MEPIISPWFFYFLNCVNNIWGVSLVVAIASGLVAAITVIIALCEFVDDEEYKNFSGYYEKYHKRLVNKAIFICVLGTLLTVFIPSKETMIEMAVAKNVTEKNVELAKDTVKNLIDYTIESVTKLSNKDSK